MKGKIVLRIIKWKIALCLLLLSSTSVYAANNASFTYNWNNTGQTTKTLTLTGNEGSQVYSFTTVDTFKLETGKTADAGGIVLTYPRYIFEDRLGAGYAQAQLILPDAPEKVPADGSFYYSFSGDDLVITNSKMVTAGMTLSFEIQYLGSATNLPVSYSKVLTTTCSVNGELLASPPSLTLNITKTFDADPAYSNVRMFSSGKWDTWQDTWGVKPALPGGADADYIYIIFNIDLTNTTGLLPEYVGYKETPENGGVIVAWGKYITDSEVSYYQDDFNTNGSYSPTDINTRRSVVVRYRISDLTVNNGNYYGYNNIEARYKLESGDEQIRSYRCQFYYPELGFNYPGDNFRISTGVSGSLIMPKKLLGNENSDRLDFYLNATSRGYLLTENGNAAYTMSYIDDMVYLDGTRLTAADYYLEDMSLAFVTFPGMTGSNIVAYKETNVNAATGETFDDTDYASYPPVEVYTRSDDTGAGVKFGSYRITGNAKGTFTPVSTGVVQPVANTTNIALPPGVTQVKFDIATKAYQTTFGAWLHARLKPSATIKSIIANNPLATVENVATLIIRDKDGNHVNPATAGTIYSENREAITQHDVALYGNVAQHDVVTTSFFPKVPTMVETARYGPNTATADDLNQRYTTDYSMFYANYSLLTATAEDFREATDEQKDGIFYDLLPVGMTIDTTSVKAWCFDEKISFFNSASYLTSANAIPVATNVDFVQNWRNSGRIMMKIHVTTTADNVIINRNGYPESGFIVRYRTYYPYTAVRDYGTKARNSFMFFSNSGEVANIHSGKPNTFPPNYDFSGVELAYDDLPVYNAYSYDSGEIPQEEIDSGWWRDMNEDGNPVGGLFNTTMPTYDAVNTDFPTQPMALESGKPFAAVNDATMTEPGVAVDIPVLDNDILLTGEGAPTVVIHGSTNELPGNLLEAPGHGTVTVKPDNTITYTPGNDTWEGIDEFEYQIYYPGCGVRSNKAKVYVLVLNTDAITCDNTRMIQLGMPEGLTCTWYTTQSGSTTVPTGNDVLTVNRGEEEHKGDYFVDRWLSINTVEFPNRIQVRTRFVPLLMYWKKNATNADWNNPLNWTDENGTGFDTDLELIPFPCTTVHIPAGAAVYPSLEPVTTNDTIYNGRADKEPACDGIYFHFGGEVVRTDLLHYSKAFVELALAANRWNMISAPLRYMYPGDYYQTDPCPHADELRIYQQLFAMQNPQTGQMEGGWTGAFNSPDIAMPAGFGYAIQLIDEGKLLDGRVISNEPWIPLPAGQRHSIWLPKNDASYNIYNIYSSDGKGNPPFRGSCDIDRTFQTVRNYPDNYHFIYEGEDGWNTSRWTGDITLSTSGASDAGMQVIVGNPFMAHWNFEDFYQQNSDKIKEEYYVLEGADDTSFTPSSPLLPSWSTSKLIAPMQSVLVTSTTAFGATDLKTRVTATAQNPGNILKSSNSNMNANLLKIVATKNGKENQTHVLFDASAGNNYLLSKDSYKLFVAGVTEAVSVYTRSADGYALDINVFGDCSQMIPLGIRTTQPGSINLQFEGVENFFPGYDIFLLDTQTGARINLRETLVYSFDKTTSDLFLDGRFYLSTGKESDNVLLPTQGTISIFTSGNRLQVVSSNYNINEVQVLDMQGRLLHKTAGVGSPTYCYDLERNRMYTVKVLTKEGVTVRKVIAGK